MTHCGAHSPAAVGVAVSAMAEAPTQTERHSSALRLQGVPGATMWRLRAISSTEDVLLLLMSYGPGKEVAGESKQSAEHSSR